MAVRLALCIIGGLLFLTECAGAAEGEICEDGAKAMVKGTIAEVEDSGDEKGKGFLLWPKEDAETNCFYQAIVIEGELPKACKAGAKFSLSGRMDSEGEGVVFAEKIVCK